MNATNDNINRSSRIATILRIVFGLIYAMSAAVFFLQLAPPPEMPPPAMSLFGALAATGYFLPFLKATEFIGGLALIANRFVALALVLLAPITVNIVLFHLFLDPSGLALTLVLTVLHLAIAWFYRESFSPILRAR